MTNQFDLICSECPLSECDENSIWCAYRWVKDPNAIQRQALESQMAENINRQFVAVTMAKKVIAKEYRRQYLSTYYQDNRERKLAASNARNAAKRTATGTQEEIR